MTFFFIFSFLMCYCWCKDFLVVILPCHCYFPFSNGFCWCLYPYIEYQVLCKAIIIFPLLRLDLLSCGIAVMRTADITLCSWIAVRVNILVLFLNLAGRLSAFHLWMLCRLVWVRSSLLVLWCWDMFHLCPLWWECRMDKECHAAAPVGTPVGPSCFPLLTRCVIADLCMLNHPYDSKWIESPIMV